MLSPPSLNPNTFLTGGISGRVPRRKKDHLESASPQLSILLLIGFHFFPGLKTQFPQKNNKSFTTVNPQLSHYSTRGHGQHIYFPQAFLFHNKALGASVVQRECEGRWESLTRKKVRPLNSTVDCEGPEVGLQYRDINQNLGFGIFGE